MIKNHKLDAPEDFKGDYDTAPPDRSELSLLYFNPEQETRPLVASEEERHRLHDQRLADQRTQLHRSVFEMTFLFAMPLIAALYLTVFTFVVANTNARTFLAAIIILLGLLWFGAAHWSYSRLMHRLYTHNVRGGLFTVFLLLILGAASPFLTWLAVLSTNQPYLQATIAAGGGLIVSLVAMKLLVIIATRSWRATGQRG